MNKSIVASAIIIVLGIISATYIWSSYSRYQIVGSSGDIAFQVDQKTGSTWVLKEHSKSNHESKQIDVKNDMVFLSNENKAKVYLRASLRFGDKSYGLKPSLSGKIYNGSNYILSEIIVVFQYKDGSLSFGHPNPREYVAEVNIKPLTVGTVYIELMSDINVFGNDKISDYNWSVVKALGYVE